jgi:hypothetical protein
MTPADETNHSRSQNGGGLISLANRHIEISRSVIDSTAEDSICDARSLLPELLVRRRAILTANGLRSSCCCCWKPRKRTPQSHAWHNVAGLCLMHFPRFRKTQTSRCDVQLHPQFAGSYQTAVRSPVFWLKNNEKRFDEGRMGIFSRKEIVAELSPWLMSCCFDMLHLMGFNNLPNTLSPFQHAFSMNKNSSPVRFSGHRHRRRWHKDNRMACLLVSRFAGE